MPVETPIRLSDAALPLARGSLIRPSYDRHKTRIGTVHFGPGAFHRAHQAFFFDRLLTRDANRAISAVSLKTASVHDALAPQDFLYVLAERDKASAYRAIGAIREILVASQSPDGVAARLAAPETTLVTATVTEKGYCLDASGDLDLSHPDIAHDLRSEAPRSLIGWLVLGLRKRRANGVAPFACISCDNLTGNGRRLGRAVEAFARRKDPDLAVWIADNVRFPNTMVDSIVPATDNALRTLVEKETGLRDAWPVQREQFAQWVIEDAPAMPDWASVGVTVTTDVAAFSNAKLRMLNAAHSTLAYLGLLAGYETVSEAVADPTLGAFVTRLLNDDIAPLLAPPPGLDLADYARAILARFANPVLRHSLSQIAMDGSKKLPERILATCVDAVRTGRPLDRLATPIAAWMTFLVRCHRGGTPIQDPLRRELSAIAASATGDGAADVGRFLAFTPIFPAELANDGRFAKATTCAYDLIARRGPLAAAAI